MTLKQTSLLPACRKDIRTLLSTFELVSGRHLQLGEIVREEIRQCITLEPSPQTFHWFEIGRIRRQECQLEMSILSVQMVTHQFAAMRHQSIQNSQRRLLELRLEFLEKLDDLFLLDATIEETKQTSLGNC